MKKYLDYIVLLLILSASLLYMRTYFPGFSNGFRDSLIVPNEFGQYWAEAIKYAQDNLRLITTVEVGKEPGLFMITSELDRIAGISAPVGLILVSALVYFLTITILYVLVLKTGNNRITGLVTVMIASSIFLTTTSFILIASRQALSHLFLLLVCATWPIDHHTTMRKKIVIGIFFGMTLMSHRVGIMFAILSAAFIGCLALMKKDFNRVKNTSYIFGLGLILAGPFLFMQIGDIIISIESYLWKLKGGTLDEMATFYNAGPKGEDGGWDFFTSSAAINNRPLVHYMFYQGFILIPIVSVFKKNITIVLGKKHFLRALFIFLCIYESFFLIFGTRILATFEIVLLSFFGISMMNLTKNRTIKIALIAGIFILNVSAASRSYIPSQIIQIKNDPSIEFIRNNIDKDSIMLGHPWVADIGNQLGYLTGNNIAFAPLYVPILGALTGTYNSNTKPISIYTTRVMARNMSISLAFQPEAHEIFKGKDMYILIIKKLEKSTFNKYRKEYLSSPYLTLLYEDKGQASYFSYIFKVNTEKLVYYDGRAYFHNNFLRDY